LLKFIFNTHYWIDIHSNHCLLTFFLLNIFIETRLVTFFLSFKIQFVYILSINRCGRPRRFEVCNTLCRYVLMRIFRRVSYGFSLSWTHIGTYNIIFTLKFQVRHKFDHIRMRRVVCTPTRFRFITPNLLLCVCVYLVYTVRCVRVFIVLPFSFFFLSLSRRTH